MSAQGLTSERDAVWRLASVADDAAIEELCQALNREDPGPEPVPVQHMRRTLRTLREEPWRGRAVVLQDADGVIGYALLVSYWSNELGGEVCTIDELYIVPEARNRGLGTSLFEHLQAGALWQPKPVALALETTPDNVRAQRLYKRNGFTGKNVTLRRLV